MEDRGNLGPHTEKSDSVGLLSPQGYIVEADRCGIECTQGGTLFGGNKPIASLSSFKGGPEGQKTMKPQRLGYPGNNDQQGG